MDQLNASSSVCLTAAYLAHNHWVIGMLILRCVLALAGLVLLFILWRVQGTHLAFHENARILWIWHHGWAILQSVTNFIVFFCNLLQYWPTHDYPCDYLATTTKVILARGPTFLAMCGQIWGLSAMAIERCVATWKYRTYEKSSSRLGECLAFIQCILASLWLFLAIIDLDWSEMRANYSTSSKKTSRQMTTLLSVLGVIEATALITFCGLFLFNGYEKKRLGDSSLTAKYQVDENMRSIKLMIPMVFTHFICFIPNLTFFPIFLSLNPEVPALEQGVYSQAFNTAPFYATVIPIILFWRNSVLRSNLKRSIGIHDNRTEPHLIQNGRTLEQIRHFEALKEVWNSTKM